MFNFRNQQGITVKELINQKIKNNLYNLTSIFKNKQNQNIPSAFILLKSFDKNNKNFHQNDNPNEKLKREVIMSQIINACKIMYETYRYFESMKKSNFFKKWNFVCKISKQMKNIEPKVKEKYYQKLSQKKDEIISQSKSQEQTLSTIKAQILALNQSIAKYNKTIKSNEEKENLFNKNIKNLEEENFKIEQEIKKGNFSQESINGNTSKSDSKKIKLENKIKELENISKKLEEEMKEKDAFFTNQVKDLNEMLDFFEEKANELDNMKLMNKNTNNVNREGHSHHKYTTKSPNNHNINYKMANVNQIDSNLQRINYKINNNNNNAGSSRGIFININNYNSNKK